MNLLKKVKVELWVLCLAGLLSLLLAISTGILVRQELVGSVKFGITSKAALFLAEIPKHIKLIFLNAIHDLRVDDRFQNLSGFQGKPLEEEKYLLLSKYDGDKENTIDATHGPKKNTRQTEISRGKNVNLKMPRAKTEATACDAHSWATSSNRY